MENFVFQCPTKIILGKDTGNEVGRETKRFSSKILLYGGGSIKRSGLYEKVVNSLLHCQVVNSKNTKFLMKYYAIYKNYFLLLLYMSKYF